MAHYRSPACTTNGATRRMPCTSVANLRGGASLANGKASFSKIYEQLRSKGGGTISIYYHPNEWVQTEFWDAVNFRRGANPARTAWKMPGTRPAAETEQAFDDFEQYVRFIKAQPGVRFVTATELMTIYADKAMTRNFGKEDLLRFARTAQKDITFQKQDGYALSAADVFGLLTDATAAGRLTRPMLELINVPTPNWPRSFAPQQNNAPSVRTPQL